MSRRAGTVANARGRVGANNAVDITLWSSYASFTGNPLDGNGLDAMTDVRSARWYTNRALRGVIHSGVQLEKIVAGNRYNDDGSLIGGADTSAAAWSQQALKNLWAGNTKTWFQRLTQLGITRKPISSAYSHAATSSSIAFETLWHDNTAWGASTVAGALTPGVGSTLEDYTRQTKAGNTAGFGGQGFDFEQATNAHSWPYLNMPGGQTEQTTRDLVVLRARQLAKVTATYRSDPTGLAFVVYKLDFTGSGRELNSYIAGAANDHIFDFNTTDSFMVGLATEPGIDKVYLFLEEYYRLVYIPGDSSANDSDRTRIDQMYRFDFGRRRARLSQMAAYASALTDAERLSAMRKLKCVPAMWPGDTNGNGPQSPTQFDRMLDGAQRWAQDGRIFQYQRGGTNQQDEVPPNDNIDQFEASYASKLISAFIDDRPTVTVTAPTLPHSSAGSTVNVQISVTITTAVDRIEVVNVTTGVTYFVPFQWIHDDAANWVPLNATKRPANTSLGLAPFHVEAGTIAPNSVVPGVNIARSVGANTIVVNVYSVHQRLSSVTFTSTRTS